MQLNPSVPLDCDEHFLNNWYDSRQVNSLAGFCIKRDDVSSLEGENDLIRGNSECIILNCVAGNTV